MTKNARLIEGFLSSVTRVIAQYTSRTYALLVINSLLADLAERYPFLTNVTVITSPYSGLSTDFFIDPAVEGAPSRDVGAALNEVLDRLSRPIGVKTRDQFLCEITGYMGRSLESELHSIGVSPYSDSC